MGGPGQAGVGRTSKRRNCQASGQCRSVDLKLIPVEFMEYPRLEGDWKKRFKDSKPVGTGSKDGKWIYVFRTTSKKNQILQYAEIKANANGKYELVNIKDPTLRKKDVRKPDPKQKPKAKVELVHEENRNRVENFFCLSRIQLPSERVEEIRSKIQQYCARTQFWSGNQIKFKNLLSGASLSMLWENRQAGAGARAMLIPVYSSKKYPDGFFGLDGVTSLHSEVKDKENTATVYLTDHLTEALRLHKEYMRSLDQYFTWKENKRNAEESYLVNLVYELAYHKEKNKDARREDSRLTKHIKKWEFLKVRKKLLKEEKRRRDAIHYRATKLCDWLESNDFKAVQLDYESGGEKFKKTARAHMYRKEGEELYQKVIECLHESRRGQLYLSRVYSKKESWMKKYLFSTTREPHEAFWKILTDITTTILNIEVDDARSRGKGRKEGFKAARDKLIELADLRRTNKEKNAFPLKPGSQVASKPQPVLGRGDPKTPVVPIVELGAKTAAKVATTGADIGSIPKLPNNLENAIDAFNIVLKIKALFLESKTAGDITKNAIGLGIAIADQIAKSTVFFDRIKKRLGKKLCRVVGFVAGLIDAVTGAWDFVKAARRGNLAAMGGAAAAVVGGVASAVGMFILKGAVAGAAVPPVAVVLLVVGILLEVVGALILLFCSWGPLEYWLRHCEWGRCTCVRDDDPHDPEDWCFDPGDSHARNKGIFKLWPRNYGRQIRALHRILYGFKIKEHKHFSSVGLGGMMPSEISVVRMKIEPSYVTDYTKFIFKSILITDKSGSKFRLKPPKKDLVLNKSFAWFEEEKSGSNTKIKSIIVEWYDEKYSSLLAKAQKLNRSTAIGIAVRGLEKFIKEWWESSLYNRVFKNLYFYHESKIDVFGDGKCVVPAYSTKREHLKMTLREALQGGYQSFYRTVVYKGK